MGSFSVRARVLHRLWLKKYAERQVVLLVKVRTNAERKLFVARHHRDRDITFTKVQ